MSEFVMPELNDWHYKDHNQSCSTRNIALDLAPVPPVSCGRGDVIRTRL
jgi:hypothetical protein